MHVPERELPEVVELLRRLAQREIGGRFLHPLEARERDVRAAKPVERSDTVTTTGTLKPSGKPEMSYTAVAGYLPLGSQTEFYHLGCCFLDDGRDRFGRRIALRRRVAPDD